MAMTSNDPLGSGYGAGPSEEVLLEPPGQRSTEYGVSVYGRPSDVQATVDTSPASGVEASTVDVAKDQAASVASGAADAAQNVAGVAKEQVGQVAAEAGQQVRQLLGQAQAELSDQAAQQQQRVAAGLHDLGDQFGAMVNGFFGGGCRR